ncbi:putative gustatory receptor 98d [Musca autumnalis]|uniref:putative gustatory receptor 98d n=1 Tax=Musca autumnalis TaxID=221902 RepID=UPI003CE9B3E5
MFSTVKPSAFEHSQLVKGILPFQWFYGFCGIALPPILLRPKTNSKLQTIYTGLAWCLFGIYVTFLNLLIIWMVWDNNIIVDIVVQRYVLDGVTKILSIAQNYDVICVQLTMVLSIVYGRKRLIRIYATVAQLERDISAYETHLEDKCDYFGKCCSSFGRRLLFQCGLFLLIHSILMGYTKYPMIWDNLSYQDKFLTLITFHLMYAKCSEYRVMMHVLYNLMYALELSLKKLKYEITRHEIMGNAGATTSTLYRKLRTHQFLLSRFWYLVQLLENYFSLPMLIIFLYNGINITHIINWIYVKSFRRNEKDTYHPYRVSYIILLFVNMMWTCWLSQNVIDKYNQIVSILHSMKIKSNDMALLHRLREYSLQLRHQKVLLTCWGFFDMNMKYFGLLSLTILTYVFILLQFKLQVETEKLKRL